MPSRAAGIGGAIGAMVAVGTGVTMSFGLVDYPVFGAQAVRYGIAALILGSVAILMRGPFPWPRGRDWVWVAGIAAVGQVLFSIALIRAVEASEPAAVAVIIGGVPLVLVAADSVRMRVWPSRLLVAGALIVVTGAALVHGFGRATGEGLAWAFVALLAEAAFTMFAVPVLPRLRPIGVSIHSCWVAAALLVPLAIIFDGADVLPPMGADEILAVAYLAIVVTSIAFLLWFSSVQRLGPAVAGLFAGLMPIAAAISGLIPGLTTITPAVLGGSILVGAGIAVGLHGTGDSDDRVRRLDA